MGSVFINCQTLTNGILGSVKESGLGKEGGMLGLAEFTNQDGHDRLHRLADWRLSWIS